VVVPQYGTRQMLAPMRLSPLCESRKKPLTVNFFAGISNIFLPSILYVKPVSVLICFNKKESEISFFANLIIRSAGKLLPYEKVGLCLICHC
jgi:hypothetical protein